MYNSREITIKIDKLPGTAKNYLLINQLINEIQSTNDIEGVKSTRKEISDAIDAQESTRNVRFKQTINMYFEMLNSEKLEILTLSDIRDIYDKVVSDEIDEEEQPDGELFRKKSVQVYDQRKEKAVHRGNPDEETVSKDLLKLIDFMNNDESVYVIKAIVTHYYFEYIHPFYDGNGRMGRFLLASYLSHKLDDFSALSLSESIFNNKKKYEEAFIDVSSPKNYGDLTLFIQSMLQIIIKGQKRIIQDIELANLKMKRMASYIEDHNFTDDQSSILFIMLQKHIFSLDDKTFENRELEKYTEMARSRIDKNLKELEELGYINKIKRKPLTYEFNEDMLPFFD
ncbi:Fic family protein [Aerococcaceae bacterium WGS1372]